MRIRASSRTIASVAALLTVVLAAGACTSPGGKLMVDAPRMLPYQAPDIDEITGIDSSEDEDEDAPAARPGPAQNPQK